MPLQAAPNQQPADMPTPQLTTLCDIASEAHTRIQQTYQDLDPVISVSENMRRNGVPADVMTIGCLQSHKRILLILHDHQPGLISYQYGLIDKDPQRGFEQIALDELTAGVLFDWIRGYFRAS